MTLKFKMGRDADYLDHLSKNIIGWDGEARTRLENGKVFITTIKPYVEHLATCHDMGRQIGL